MDTSVYFYCALVENQNGFSVFKNFHAVINSGLYFTYRKNKSEKYLQKKLSNSRKENKSVLYGIIGNKPKNIDYEITMKTETEFEMGDDICCVTMQDIKYKLLDGFFSLQGKIVNISPNGESLCKIVTDHIGHVYFPKEPEVNLTIGESETNLTAGLSNTNSTTGLSNTNSTQGNDEPDKNLSFDEKFPYLEDDDLPPPLEYDDNIHVTLQHIQKYVYDGKLSLNIYGDLKNINDKIIITCEDFLDFISRSGKYKFETISIPMNFETIQ